MVAVSLQTECRMLMEACRFYDIDAVAEWACTKDAGQAKRVEDLRARASSGGEAFQRRLRAV
jgi:hypothetical protein